MIDWKEIYKSTDIKWLKSIISEGYSIEKPSKTDKVSSSMKIPAASRLAALRLYELGEKEYAFGILVDQMIQYKKSDIPLSTKYETCVDAMVALGQLGEDKAIVYLMEALEEFTDVAALSLSIIGGHDLEMMLVDLSKGEGIRAFGAALALGFMSNREVISQIEEMINNTEQYSEKYSGKLMWHLRDTIMYILGNYQDERAEKLFKRNINKSTIRRFVLDFIRNEKRSSYYKYIDATTLGWRIFKKYNLGNYSSIKDYEIMTEDKIDKIVDEIWDNFSKAN